MVPVWNLHLVLSLMVVTPEKCEICGKINYKPTYTFCVKCCFIFQQLWPLLCAKFGCVYHNESPYWQNLCTEVDYKIISFLPWTEAVQDSISHGGERDSLTHTHPSRLALAPIHSIVQWVLGLFLGGKVAGRWPSWRVKQSKETAWPLKTVVSKCW